MIVFLNRYIILNFGRILIDCINQKGTKQNQICRTHDYENLMVF